MAKHGLPDWMLAAPRWGARLGWFWLLLGILASCSGDSTAGVVTEGPLVRVHLSPVDPLTTHADLSITAPDATSQPVMRMTKFSSAPFDVMGVTFPVGTRGGTTYQVNLYSEPSCLLATGQSTLTIDSDGVFDVAVTVTPVLLCGNGATLTVQVINAFGGIGYVASTPAGTISCPDSPSKCSFSTMKGTTITLTAQASAGAFAGWSGSTCTGTGTCVLTLTQDVQLQALFTNCHGWCKEPLGFPVTANLNGVSGTGVNNVLIVGDAGTALHWDGTSWQQLQPPSGPTVALRAAAAPKTNGTTIAVAGDLGTILQLTGTTWKTITNSMGTDAMRAIAIGPGTAPSTYFAGDKGTTLVLGNTSSSVMAGGIKASVTIYGLSQNPNGSAIDLYLGGAINPSNGFAESWDGNNGTTAQTGGSGVSIVGNINAMLCGNMYHYAAGDNGAIIRRLSAGNNSGKWMTVTNPAARTLRGMWSSSDSNIVAVGDGGTIVQYDGSTWTPPVSGVTANLRAVWGSGSTNIYAVGDNGTVLHYLP